MVKKNTSKEVEKKIPALEDFSFLDKNGKQIKISEVIDKTTDCWLLKNKSLWILTHAGVEKIAARAGISKNYDVEESKNVTPTYQNELEHIVRVTLKCNAVHKTGTAESDLKCVHSDENTLTVTGESNRINTPNRGRGYLRKMAEKRAWDIAVLKHLDLYSAIYSEEEADDFKNPGEDRESKIMPGSKEFEAIVEEINMILNADSKTALKEVGKKIKKFIKDGKYSEKQEQYLISLGKKQIAELSDEF